MEPQFLGTKTTVPDDQAMRNFGQAPQNPLRLISDLPALFESKYLATISAAAHGVLKKVASKINEVERCTKQPGKNFISNLSQTIF